MTSRKGYTLYVRQVSTVHYHVDADNFEDALRAYLAGEGDWGKEIMEEAVPQFIECDDGPVIDASAIDMGTCAQCGIYTPLRLLDAKDDGTGNFNRLECEQCYGPGWVLGVPTPFVEDN